MVWYSHLFQNFPQFIVIHTVNGFSVINEVEVDSFFWNSLAFQMRLYKNKYPTDAIRKLLEFNKFGKIAEYKINTQKSLAFLYTSDEKSKRGIWETIPLTIASNRNATLS